MNLIILTAVIAIASAGQLPSRSYIPQGQNQAPGQGSGGFGNQGGSGFGGQGTHGGQGNFGGQSGSGGFGQGGHSSNFGGSQGFGHQAQNGFGGSGGFNGNGNGNRPQQSKEANAAILKQDQGIEESGSYHFGYETENGIRAEEAGNPSQAQGGFSYKGDDGQTYTITYTSGEGGFRPQGEHLPIAPPTPEAILEALQKNAQDEAAGIFDDGLYRPDAHSGPGGNRPGQSGGHFGNGNRPGQGHGGQGQSGFGGNGNHQNGFNANSGYTY